MKAIPLTHPVSTRGIGLVMEKRELHAPIVEALKAQARRIAGQLALIPD